MDAKQAIDWIEQQAYMAHTHDQPEDSLTLQQIAALIERQERMIEKACEWMQKIGCPVLDDHYCDENCSTEMNGSGCWRRWLEEAQHDQ